jgi:hypothetical protein
MTRRKSLLAIAVVAAVAAIAAGSASAFAVPSPLADSAGIWTAPTCVTPTAMSRLVGEPMAPGVSTLGLTNMYTRHVWLLDRICVGLAGWQRSTGDTVKPAELESLVTLFHEAAHAHGVRNERAAECAGVRGALRTIAGRYAWLESTARQWFLHDDEQFRPAAYKLRGTCYVPRYAS